MIKRYYVQTKQLRKGMRIDQSVQDRIDRVLIKKGTILDEYLINGLKELGISGVYVSEGEEDETANAGDKEAEKLSAIAKNNIAKNREPDPAKVQLSESVKKRVSQGMQFLYNNTESAEFVSTSNHITKNLLKAITDNEAVAVDIATLKTSDEYTFKHSVDVATMSMIVAKNMGMSQSDVYNIGISGLLHDIGKSKVPLEILNKPARLEPEEFEIMKQHSMFGYQILNEKKDVTDMISFAVLQHHEKMNGKGYPMGVTSEKILPYAKILSVVDVYDALVTERPYKKGLSQRTAIEMIMSMTEELDINSMKSFLASVILYPVDSTVQLSNGETAKVVKNNKGAVLRPVVVGMESGTVYDLANDLKCASILIE